MPGKNRRPEGSRRPAPPAEVDQPPKALSLARSSATFASAASRAVSARRCAAIASSWLRRSSPFTGSRRRSAPRSRQTSSPSTSFRRMGAPGAGSIAGKSRHPCLVRRSPHNGGERCSCVGSKSQYSATPSAALVGCRLRHAGESRADARPRERSGFGRFHEPDSVHRRQLSPRAAIRFSILIPDYHSN